MSCLLEMIFFKSRISVRMFMIIMLYCSSGMSAQLVVVDTVEPDDVSEMQKEQNTIIDAPDNAKPISLFVSVRNRGVVQMHTDLINSKTIITTQHLVVFIFEMARRLNLFSIDKVVHALLFPFNRTRHAFRRLAKELSSSFGNLDLSTFVALLSLFFCVVFHNRFVNVIESSGNARCNIRFYDIPFVYFLLFFLLF